jgi:hypothetical protein
MPFLMLTDICIKVDNDNNSSVIRIDYRCDKERSTIVILICC